VQDLLVGGVVETGQQMVIPKISPEQLNAFFHDELGNYFHDFGLHGILAAPIQHQDQTFGMILLTRESPENPYTVDDQMLAQDIIQRAGMAITNFRLFQELQKELIERRRVEGALFTSQSRLQSILKEAGIGIGLVDSKGYLIQSNPALQGLLEYSEEELSDRALISYLCPDHVDQINTLHKQLFNGVINQSQVESCFVKKTGDQVWAQVTLSAVKGPDRLPMFIIAMIEDITERKNLQEELSRVPYHLLASVEEERQRVSQELHDGPIQELYALIYRIANLQGNSDAGLDWNNLQEEIKSVIEELREISVELRPPALKMGVGQAILSHAQNLQKQLEKPNIDLSISFNGKELPEKTRLDLFRIYQIAIMNVIRHAHADRAWVRLFETAENISLEIQDNGRGFELPERLTSLAAEGHLGLVAMSERASAIGGKLQITSTPGDGTLIQIVIPKERIDGE
jgi:PAS domain S-box-containing protein